MPEIIWKVRVSLLVTLESGQHVYIKDVLTKSSQGNVWESWFVMLQSVHCCAVYSWRWQAGICWACTKNHKLWLRGGHVGTGIALLDTACCIISGHAALVLVETLRVTCLMSYNTGSFRLCLLFIESSIKAYFFFWLPDEHNIAPMTVHNRCICQRIRHLCVFSSFPRNRNSSLLRQST